jgi:hypothetical protein
MEITGVPITHTEGEAATMRTLVETPVGISLPTVARRNAAAMGPPRAAQKNAAATVPLQVARRNALVTVPLKVARRNAPVTVPPTVTQRSAAVMVPPTVAQRNTAAMVPPTVAQRNAAVMVPPTVAQRSTAAMVPHTVVRKNAAVMVPLRVPMVPAIVRQAKGMSTDPLDTIGVTRIVVGTINLARTMVTSRRTVGRRPPAVRGMRQVMIGLRDVRTGRTVWGGSISTMTMTMMITIVVAVMEDIEWARAAKQRSRTKV